MTIRGSVPDPQDHSGRDEGSTDAARGDNADGDGVLIRDARGEDCEALARIYNESIDAGRSTMDTQPVQGSLFRPYLDQTDRCALIVGEIGSEIFGWAVVKPYSDRLGYRYACETSIFLAARHQHLGHGCDLFAAIMDRARSLGYHHVVAKILAVNDGCIRFLERFGFETIGRQRAIGYLNGEWQDVVIMQRIFDDVSPADAEGAER